MSLNNIILPDLLLSHLYKDTLVLVNEIVTAEKKEKIDSPQFLGKHLKQIAVFVHYDDEIYLPENQLNFLASILKACNLNIADIAIINLSKQVLTFEQLKKMETRKVIFFDTEPGLLAIDKPIPAFSIQDFNNISMLKAPALEALNQPNEESKLLKSKLWLCLRELFTVK